MILLHLEFAGSHTGYADFERCSVYTTIRVLRSPQLNIPPYHQALIGHLKGAIGERDRRFKGDKLRTEDGQ